MKERKGKTILIIGAGFAGRAIASEISSKEIMGKVTVLVDDDPEKIGGHYLGIPILGPLAAIAGIQNRFKADEALIAIPSIARKRLITLYNDLKKLNFTKIRILPSVSQIVDGKAHLIQTRDIHVQDLLGRDPVVVPLKESLAYLRGKRVLITGAGGSIGSELARQLLSGGAQRLYLFDHDENSLYEVEKELKTLQQEGVGEKATIIPIIGELKDSEYVDFIIQRLKNDVVFHCAAYKHVPMLEENPVEAVKNNVFGTLNLVNATKKTQTSRFVLISTDKAVEPTSIYGASKMLAEEIVLGSRSDTTEFMVVRFGNVLGSRGSIVPLFKNQILNGGPVTLTHPDMVRFFMTIPEAASLVLKTGGVGSGGNLYILDMGDPVSIQKFARQMIRFYGYDPHKEIPIVYTGIRPGEKLKEILWSRNETPESTDHPGINRLPHLSLLNSSMSKLLAALKPICYFHPQSSHLYRNHRQLRKLLARYLPTLESTKDEQEY